MGGKVLCTEGSLYDWQKAKHTPTMKGLFIIDYKIDA